MKKQKKNKLVNKRLSLAAILALGVIIGFLAGQVLKPKSATPRQIEAAKNQVVLLHSAQGRVVSACPEVGENIELKMGKVVPNYRSIKINKYANRAIVTDCAEKDELFVKTQDGMWDNTNVDLQLSNRANATWLKECLIDDIVVADEIIRSENSSIDAMNLKECKRIKSL